MTIKKFFLSLLLSLCAASAAFAQQKVYDESLDAMEQIRNAVAEAKASNRYVMCQVGGNWCPWCLRFAQFATTDSVVAPLMQKDYVYIHVNYSKANKNLEAMRFLGTRFNALDDCYTVIPASLPARTESNFLDSCPTHCAMPTSLKVASQTRRKLEHLLEKQEKSSVKN